MNVAALQKHIRDLATFLSDAGGASTVSGELTAVSEALAPFKDRKVKELAEFLRKAEEYERTGLLSVKKPANSGGNSKTAPASTDSLKAQLATLYAEAPSATDGRIEAVMAALDQRGVTVEALRQLAAAVEVDGKVKKMKKADVLATIRAAITTRRAMSQRAAQ